MAASAPEARSKRLQQTCRAREAAGRGATRQAHPGTATSLACRSAADSLRWSWCSDECSDMVCGCQLILKQGAGRGGAAAGSGRKQGEGIASKAYCCVHRGAAATAASGSSRPAHRTVLRSPRRLSIAKLPGRWASVSPAAVQAKRVPRRFRCSPAGNELLCSACKLENDDRAEPRRRRPLAEAQGSLNDGDATAKITRPTAFDQCRSSGRCLAMRCRRPSVTVWTGRSAPVRVAGGPHSMQALTRPLGDPFLAQFCHPERLISKVGSQPAWGAA